MGANEHRRHRRNRSAARKTARFLTGAGQFTDDSAAATRRYGVLPALAARAREDPQDRHGEGEGGAGRGRRSSPAPTSTGVNGLPCGWLITSTDGKPMKEPPHPVLAQGKVRHVGDQVALVVAETLAPGEGRRRADRRRLRSAAGGRQLRRRAEAGRAADPRRARRATTATPGRSATRRRSTRRSPRRRTSRSSTSSTTG